MDYVKICEEQYWDSNSNNRILVTPRKILKMCNYFENLNSQRGTEVTLSNSNYELCACYNALKFPILKIRYSNSDSAGQLIREQHCSVLMSQPRVNFTGKEDEEQSKLRYCRIVTDGITKRKATYYDDFDKLMEHFNSVTKFSRTLEEKASGDPLIVFMYCFTKIIRLFEKIKYEVLEIRYGNNGIYFRVYGQRNDQWKLDSRVIFHRNELYFTDEKQSDFKREIYNLDEKEFNLEESEKSFKELEMLLEEKCMNSKRRMKL